MSLQDESIVNTEFQAGKTQMRTNKLEDGVKTFKKILHLFLLNAVSSPTEVNEVCNNQVVTFEEIDKNIGQKAHHYLCSIRSRYGN